MQCVSLCCHSCHHPCFIIVRLSTTMNHKSFIICHLIAMSQIATWHLSGARSLAGAGDLALWDCSCCVMVCCGGHESSMVVVCGGGDGWCWVGVMDDGGAVRESVVNCWWHPNQALVFANIDKAGIHTTKWIININKYSRDWILVAFCSYAFWGTFWYQFWNEFILPEFVTPRIVILADISAKFNSSGIHWNPQEMTGIWQESVGHH